MELDVNGKSIVRNPNMANITRALHRISGNGGHFAILSRNKMTYLQAIYIQNSGFHLEYQSSSVDKHYHCTDEGLDLKKVTRAFELYFMRDGRWRTELRWERERMLSRRRFQFARIIESGYIGRTAFTMFVGFFWGFLFGYMTEESTGKPIQWMPISVLLAIFAFLANIGGFLLRLELNDATLIVCLVMWCSLFGFGFLYRGVVERNLGGIIVGLMFVATLAYGVYLIIPIIRRGLKRR